MTVMLLPAWHSGHFKYTYWSSFFGKYFSRRATAISPYPISDGGIANAKMRTDSKLGMVLVWRELDKWVGNSK